MNQSPVVASNPVVKIAKTEAVERLTKNAAAVKVQLEAATAALKAAGTGEKYALKFQADALKKQAHFFKAQIARLKKEPRAEVIWSDRFGA